MIRLETQIANIAGTGKFITRLKKLGVKTVRNLLWHFPARYEDFSRIYQIADLAPHQEATIQGVVKEIGGRRTWRRGLYLVEALVSDESGSIRAVWFNQPYIKNILQPGRIANFSGKVTLSDESEIYLSNPVYELLTTHSEHAPTHTARIVPIYPETKGLTSRGLRYLIKPILENLEPVEEIIPFEILEGNGLPEANQALYNIHFPETIEEALAAKKRFALEDLFLLQLLNLKQKMALAKEKAFSFKADVAEIKKIISRLPFELTLSQKKSLWEIVQDFGKNNPMNRLLQGDVGSGKTIIAAIAAITTAERDHQTAFMAPTEVLARQHYNTLSKFFPEFGMGIALLTSSEAKAFYGRGLETNLSKEKILKSVSVGETKIVIGTHALIQKNVKFNSLAFVVIDEQHRFGVKQRQALLCDPNNTNTPEYHEQNNKRGAEKIVEKELSYRLGKIFFEVQDEMGRFARERQYADLLAKRLGEAGISYQREVPINAANRKSNFADFIINKRIILEIKAKTFTEKEDYYQTLRYLESANLELGLIINFRQKFLKPKRILNPKYSQRKFGSFGPSSSSLGRLMPHFLSMSATPIPRTLSLTLFGDLDLSLITELPKNRKPIITKAIEPKNRKKAYDFIRNEIKKGRQVFVICPRIEPETKNQQLTTKNLQQLEIKSVKEEYEKLSKKVFPDLRVAMLHGKMRPKEKESTMQQFSNRTIDVLISTSVIEVGVDIPNATIMMIEGADRFGLAQLYQFRGRVGRGAHQSYCFLFTDSSSKTTHDRLKSIVEVKNGFELAEKDLKIRGPGEFLGQSQTGMPDLAMKALQNPELIKEAREAAVLVLKEDSALRYHENLYKRLRQFRDRLHKE